MAILSDFNVKDDKPTNVARAVPYADMSLGLELFKKRFNNEQKADGTYGKVGDFAPLTDIDAVKNAVRILVLTNFYERPFEPFLGGNLSRLLFENADIFTAESIKREIIRVVTDHEPRISGIKCEVSDKSDINSYDVTLSFNVISLQTSAEVNFFLKRIR